MILEKLAQIQSKIHAAKTQYNSFGKYNYRSCEDICEAVKPLLDGVVITLNDEVVLIGNRYYIKATASIQCGEGLIQSNAYAREEDVKKGMDAAQITGAASSYARKYALAGLLLLDDNRDEDTPNKSTDIKNEPLTDNPNLVVGEHREFTKSFDKEFVGLPQDRGVRVVIEISSIKQRRFPGGCQYM